MDISTFFYYSPIVFLLGICVGSFLNVIIDRVPKNLSIVVSRSNCDYCHKNLSPLDLIPIVSFVVLRGKCRYCHKKLSFYYPLVEITTGIIFLINFLVFTNYYQMMFAQVVSASLIAIFFTDLKYGLIPDKITYTTVLFILLYSPLIRTQKLFLEDIIVASFIAIFFLFTVIFTKGKGMGGGDVKYAFLIGIILGWQRAILSIFLSFVLGGVAGIILIVFGKKRFGQTIPFGPFLSLATYISLISGDKILDFYLKNFLHI